MASAPPPRRILLVDADAFFVAVARLEDPDGVGRASLVIVGGAPGSRGVVCSASYETRRFGVRSAMPIARALRLCPDALCVPVPRGACSQKHHEIRTVLERFAPAIQAASIDEWYLDLQGTEALYHDATLVDVAHRIRDAVRAETGLSVSIGGGTSKLVAKLAVERAKPKSGATGVHVVPPGGELAFMQQLLLADIPGIGPMTTARLAERGLRTVNDVLALDGAALARLVGGGDAVWLGERVRGIDVATVSAHDEPKSISRDETFDADVHDDLLLEGELTELVSSAGADLRREGLCARTVTVRIRDTDFRTRQASRTLDESLASDRALYAVACELLRKLRRARRVPARLLGVGLANFASPAPKQLALFDPPPAPLETARDRELSRAVDAVRARFGRSAISPGRKH
jgi:DNA polymerase IV